MRGPGLGRDGAASGRESPADDCEFHWKESMALRPVFLQGEEHILTERLFLSHLLSNTWLYRR